MSIASRLEQLEPRERRLLNVLLVVFAIIAVVVVPLGFRSLLLGGSERNERLREAIGAIRDRRSALAKRAAAAEQIASRYAKPAPPLAELLETLAKEQELQIPESQDRPAVPHGKLFEERSNRIVLRRVGLLALAKFMESIAKSGHPVAVSDLELRKRGPDAYDVTMVVSAYDRKEKAPEKAKAATDGDAGAEPLDEEEVK